MPTVIRDVPGWGVYFWSYEALKIRHEEWKRRNKKEATETYSDTLCKMVYGGLAGIASWTVSYPFDILKTHM